MLLTLVSPFTSTDKQYLPILSELLKLVKNGATEIQSIVAGYNLLDAFKRLQNQDILLAYNFYGNYVLVHSINQPNKIRPVIIASGANREIIELARNSNFRVIEAPVTVAFYYLQSTQNKGLLAVGEINNDCRRYGCFILAQHTVLPLITDVIVGRAQLNKGAQVMLQRDIINASIRQLKYKGILQSIVYNLFPQYSKSTAKVEEKMQLNRKIFGVG